MSSVTNTSKRKTRTKREINASRARCRSESAKKQREIHSVENRIANVRKQISALKK